MPSVSDAPARHGSAGPMDSFSVSLAGAVGALACSAALVASADSLGRALELLLVFVLLTSVECVAYVEAVRPWLVGDPVRLPARVLQVGVVLLVLATFVGGPELGVAGLCALAAGVLLPNASAIRFRRVNRDLVDGGEPWLAEKGDQEAATRVLSDDAGDVLEDDPEPDRPPPVDRPARARPAPKVGTVLLAAVDEERGRWLGWAAATLVITVACVAAGAPRSVVLGADLLGVAALAWVTSRLLGTRLALHDFEEALTEPRRAFAAVLRDPKPRGTRPLLALWSKEPVLAGGRLPRAEAVYRCDARRGALFSTRGAVIVHQAWVDSGPRAGSRPRWVAADAGVALPRKRAILGPRRVDAELGKERPARSRTLSMPAPNPTTESETGTFVTVISEPVPDTRHFVVLLAWRLAVLAIAAVLLLWIAQPG